MSAGSGSVKAYEQNMLNRCFGPIDNGYLEHSHSHCLIARSHNKVEAMTGQTEQQLEQLPDLHDTYKMTDDCPVDIYATQECVEHLAHITNVNSKYFPNPVLHWIFQALATGVVHSSYNLPH